MFSNWDSRRSKIGKIKLSKWHTRSSESGIKIFLKWIKEYLKVEFNKIQELGRRSCKIRKKEILKLG